MKQMIGNGVEMSSIFYGILDPLVLGWAPNHFLLGAQLATVGQRLVCISDNTVCSRYKLFNLITRQIWTSA